MKFIKIGLLLLTSVLIAAFFMCLPDMRTAPEIGNDSGNNRKKNALVCICITLAYSLLAFTGLGTLNDPQTFAELTSGSSVLLELEEPSPVDRVFLYSGITVGEYCVSLSPDGHEFYAAAPVNQDFAQILKWKNPEWSAIYPGSVRFIKLTGVSGNPRIGEIGAFSGRTKLTFKASENAAACAVTDEQNTVPTADTYLNSSYFDEIYHVRTAKEHIEGISPYEISHPPLGKLIIGLGIRIFGLVPFGWRFMGTLFGVLMVPAIYIFLTLMFHNTLVSACGSILLASDFMHFTQTRIATIDSFAVLFIILMYLFMYRFVAEGKNRDLALSGVLFGLGAASKWTCLYAGAGLAVIWLAYWCGKIITARNQKKDTILRFLKNCGFCILFFVLVPAVIYYVSYAPYGVARGLTGPRMFFSREYFRTVMENQSFMLNYHKGVNSTHPYSSTWYQWMLDIRPILYYLKYYSDGTRSSFGAFVNPALCWGGLIAMLMLVYVTVRHKDNTAAFIVLGYLAQLVPWIPVSRILFEYHYFACTVFLVLAMGYMFSAMSRLKRGKWFVVGYAMLSVVLFGLFYPAISGKRVDSSLASALLAWLPTWPF